MTALAWFDAAGIVAAFILAIHDLRADTEPAVRRLDPRHGRRTAHHHGRHRR